jgi:squalene cyclase
VSDVQELKRICTQTLMGRQLADGGWSFLSTSTQSAVEPTALALLGLPADAAQERGAAIGLLLDSQNPNGSWPAFVGDDPEGSGLTGLVLYALQRCGVTGVPVERAIQWLLKTRGQESHWFWKWKFRTADRHVRFDPDKFGWPWMNGTVSWVVPTAYSLLALKAGSAGPKNDLLQFRVQRGVDMLYDRACPHGGWNAGNGVVYEQPMAPHPDTTALASLALQAEASRPSITEGLDWLEQRAKTCSAPWSLAWSVLALNAFGRRTELAIGRLVAAVRPDQIENSAALAVVSLALACKNERNVFGVNREN